MGWERIEEWVVGHRSGRGPSIIPYVTVGFPDIATTLELVPALEQAGASVVELGVPFSDPLADGPTIQRCGLLALRQGVTLRLCLDVCARLRGRGVAVPLVLMGYYNPLLAYGLEALARDAASSGVDGFIVPDLPAEETAPLWEACQPHHLAVVPLLAPTSTEHRVAQACAQARGFVYCVSLLGVTGARQEMSAEVFSLVSTVRRHTQLPVAAGFGVSSAEHVAALGEVAEAVVVGSALLEAIGAAPAGQEAARARRFLHQLRAPERPAERGLP